MREREGKEIQCKYIQVHVWGRLSVHMRLFVCVCVCVKRSNAKLCSCPVLSKNLNIRILSKHCVTVILDKVIHSLIQAHTSYVSKQLRCVYPISSLGSWQCQVLEVTDRKWPLHCSTAAAHFPWSQTFTEHIQKSTQNTVVVFLTLYFLSTTVHVIKTAPFIA